MTQHSHPLRGRGASTNPAGRKGWRPRVLAMSGVTDAYQPAERRLEITRRCLEVLVETRNPVLIVTKILNRVRSLRGGELNDSRFFSRFHAQGPFAEQVRGLFRLGCRRHGFEHGPPALSAAAFRRPGGDQLTLFGGNEVRQL